MASLFFLTSLRRLVLSAFLLLSTSAAFAQAMPPAPHGYDFLTVTTIESISNKFAKILIMPSFQGKSAIDLEEYSGLGIEKYLDKIQRNTQLINQQLSDLTVAGWELVETHVAPLSAPALSATRYLFRKAKS